MLRFLVISLLFVCCSERETPPTTPEVDQRSDPELYQASSALDTTLKTLSDRFEISDSGISIRSRSWRFESFRSGNTNILRGTNLVISGSYEITWFNDQSENRQISYSLLFHEGSEFRSQYVPREALIVTLPAKSAGVSSGELSILATSVGIVNRIDRLTVTAQALGLEDVNR